VQPCLSQVSSQIPAAETLDSRDKCHVNRDKDFVCGLGALETSSGPSWEALPVGIRTYPRSAKPRCDYDLLAGFAGGMF
jgi:hypothetical protein